MSSLRDQVALVTGSSRGIAAGIAKSFAQQGAKVVVHGRDGAAKIDETVTRITCASACWNCRLGR